MIIVSKGDFAMYRSIDLFAGIGGIRKGFDNAFGNDIETVFVSEWDEYAQKTYRLNYHDDFEIAGDITKISEKDIPEFDICLAGFPCQAFSLAGRRMGFDDDYKGMCRGTLFQDVVRICEYRKPKVIFCENVKGLTIHDRGRTFKVIKKAFEQIGYRVYDRVLNSRDFGVPQNRERIYIVAFRNDIDSSSFQFPEGNSADTCIRDILEEREVSVKYYLSTVYVDTLRKHKERHKAKGNGFGYEIRDLDGQAGAIVCGGMGRERNLVIDKRLTNFVPITHIKGEVNHEGIRKMTPREWARLQGFPDDFKLELADTHLYKQFGNSVTVNVIEAIAKEIRKVLEMAKNKDGRMSGNKGEWSELYAFMKLLSQGRVYAANEKVEKIDSVYYPILKIMREEQKGEQLDYVIKEDEIVVEVQSRRIMTIDRNELDEQADNLLKQIATHSGSFELEEVAAFANGIKVTKIKAPSSDTTDISMQIQDIHTNYVRDVGFSIKSEVGHAPTLLNAGKTTNFIYKVKGISSKQAEEINNIDTRNKIIDRMAKIREYGGKIEFCGMNHDGFKRNLIMVDSSMPGIIANMLLYFYDEDIKDCKTLVKLAGERDPLGYGDAAMYEYKFKKFLCSCALGMKPAKVWDGLDEANGGYIIVKADGEILAYHIYNRNFFEQYLLDNTICERASTSRHEYMSLYEDGGEMYLKLNLQVRFR